MERGLFRRIGRTLRSLGSRRDNGRYRYTDAGILAVYLWAALHDRPVSWACDEANWSPGMRRGPLPSASAVSRRMRGVSMRRLMHRLERRLVSSGRWVLVASIDGKPMPIAWHSGDRQAGVGRGVGGLAKGYKLHAVIDLGGRMLAWRVAPMNIDEREMARRLLRDLGHEGYLLADGNYDSNKLFDAAGAVQIQLVAPRRRGPRAGLGHRRHSVHRLRCRDLLENTESDFGRELHRKRGHIERYFGTMSSTPGGLIGLPAWVRGMNRVHNWVAAKIIIVEAKATLKATV